MAMRQVDDWRCHRELGSGGNATVYAATRGRDPHEIALKVLKSKSSESEPYARFRQEIEFLSGLGNQQGVLPLLDASLPERPSRQTPAWLAMPIATPVTDALADASIDTVLGAGMEIAETLARLAGEHGVAHRDIKPKNLYFLQDQWLVGDFGLVDVPDNNELTEPGRPIGPVNFQAPEMISMPMTADGLPADIYSLSKTLWVLLTKQNVPPPGHHDRKYDRYPVSDFIVDWRARYLDELIERGTRVAPAERPSMEELARDLKTILTRDQESPVSVDVQALRKRYRSATVRHRTEEGFVNRKQERFWFLQEVARKAMESVDSSLLELDDQAMTNGYAGPAVAPGVDWDYQQGGNLLCGEMIGGGIGPIKAGEKAALLIRRWFQLLEMGQFSVAARIDVVSADEKTLIFNWGSGWHRVEDVENADAEDLVSTIHRELADRLPEALEIYIQQLELDSQERD